MFLLFLFHTAEQMEFKWKLEKTVSSAKSITILGELGKILWVLGQIFSSLSVDVKVQTDIVQQEA